MGKLDYASWKKSVRFYVDKIKGPDFPLEDELLNVIYKEFNFNAQLAAWEYILLASINPLDI